MPMQTSNANDLTETLEELLDERILLLDGAMGTQIHDLGLHEAATRGERFARHDRDLKNFADILCVTRPDDIPASPRPYLQATAHLVATHTSAASPPAP